MKKEEFVKLGVDDELAKKLEDASQEELKGYIPKARFDEVNNEKKKLESDVKDRDEQLEKLKNSTDDVEGLKKQISDLQAENKKKDDEHKAEVRQLKIDAAVDSALVAAKAKNTTAVRALLKDLDKADFNDDGTIKGLSDQIKALQKSDAYLFDANTSGKKQMKGAKPGEGKDDDDGGNGGVDTSKMTYSEMMAYLAENPDAKIE